MSLQRQEERFNKLEERCNKAQEVVEEKTKGMMESIFMQIKGELEKVIKTFIKDTEVNISHTIYVCS